MRTSFSAYLSIFNDWDMLADALRSIAPYIDELVVVDGAYEWLVPYYTALGVDPVRSDARVYAAIAACGVRTRFINRVWKTEIEKRMAGYAACTGRHVFRIDADEILLFHEDRMARFLGSGGAVAAMEMPIVAAPGLIRVTGPDAVLEWQCLLFDTRQVDAAAHLRYLWLVLGPEALPLAADSLPPMFPEPVAFNSHLTEWRTPATSRFRAAFYTLNHARTHGPPWTAWTNGEPVRDLDMLMNQLVSPPIWQDVLLTGDIVAGAAAPRGKQLRQAPYGTEDDPCILRAHGAHRASLAELNRETAASGRHFVNGEAIILDLTTDAARDPLCHDGAITLHVPARPIDAVARMFVEYAGPPWEALSDLPATMAHDRLTIPLPAAAPPPAAVISRRLWLRVWCARPGPVHRFAVARE